MLTLLQYWQEAALRERVSHADFDLTQTYPLTPEALKTGLLSLSKGQSTSVLKKVWVAPWWAEKKAISSKRITPLWIPADLIEGQLRPSSTCPLPWLCTATVIFESVEHYDKRLLDHFFDEQGTMLTHASWQAYLEACLALFQALLKPQLKAILDLDYSVYTADNGGWMLENTQEPNNETLLLSPLVARYANLEEVASKAPKTITEQYDIQAPLLITGYYPNQSALSMAEKEVLLSLLSLQPFEVQALHTPAGSEKNKVIKALLASCWSTGAIDDQVPVIVWVGPKKPALDSLALFNKQDSSRKGVEIQSEIQKTFQSFKQGIQLFSEIILLNKRLTHQFGSIEAIDDILVNRQTEDQSLELEFERCVQRLSQWQNQESASLWMSVKKWLPKAKKRKQRLAAYFFKGYIDIVNQDVPDLNIEQLMLEKIRRIKVTRTKIHTELVDLCQWLASKNGTKNRCLDWFKQHVSKETASESLEDKMSDIERCFGEQLFNLACAYFKISSETGLVKLASLDEAHSISEQGEIDYLIIDYAHKISPAKILPLLAKSKRAIFLGDAQGFPMPAFTSPVYDRALLKAYHLAMTEEALEDLSYQGIQASASAFCVAKAVSMFQTTQVDGFTTQCELTLEPIPRSQPALSYVHINGEHEAFDLSYRNVKEAKAIGHWLKANRGEAHQVTIITLFEGQKTYLMDCLSQWAIECPVLLLSEIDTLNKNIILFSPSYTRAQAKPYLLDQKDTLLKLVLSYAQQSVIIFSDMGIFNPHTHTPSGRMAKLLFKSPQNRLLVTPQEGVEKIIHGFKAHQTLLWSALKKAKKEITIVSSQVSEGCLRALVEKIDLKTQTGDFTCRLYLSNSPVAGPSWKSAAILAILNQLCDNGVIISIVSGLHINAFWTDNHALVEGTQPWLQLEKSLEESAGSILYTEAYSVLGIPILREHLEAQTLRQLQATQPLSVI